MRGSAVDGPGAGGEPTLGCDLRALHAHDHPGGVAGVIGIGGHIPDLEYVNPCAT
jgi:hypothetical protein